MTVASYLSKALRPNTGGQVRFWRLRFNRPGLRTLMALAAMLVLFLVLIRPVGGCQEAHADADSVPSDFCYRTTVTITNNTGGDLTNYPIRVVFNAKGLVDSVQMDPRGWDFVPVNPGNTEVESTIQDLNLSDAGFWILLDSLLDGRSKRYLFYTGNEENKRDQGIFFTGSDSVSVAATSTLGLTTNFAVDVVLELTDGSAQDATLVSRWLSNQGYRLRLVNSGGILQLQAQADTFQQVVTWDSTWTGVTSLFRMRVEDVAFDADLDLELFRDGVSIGGPWDTNLAAVSATSTALTMGNSLVDGTIRSVSIWQNTDSTFDPVSRWLFEPRHCPSANCAVAFSETSDTNPYTGTSVDSGPSGLTATYTFDRDQTGISVSVGGTGLTTAPLIIELASASTEILGPVFAENPFTSINENENIPLFPIFDAVVDDLGIPRQMFWTSLALLLGFALNIVVVAATKQVIYGAAAGSLPLLVAVAAELAQPWTLIFWIIICLAVWGASNWREQA